MTMNRRSWFARMMALAVAPFAAKVAVAKSKTVVPGFDLQSPIVPWKNYTCTYDPAVMRKMNRNTKIKAKMRDALSRHEMTPPLVSEKQKDNERRLEEIAWGRSYK